MNKLYKSLIYDGQMSLAVLETTDMVNESIKIHGLTPLTSAALGRSLTACTFMASTLKNEKDTLTVTVAGNGNGGKITVLGNGALNMRGYIDNPLCDLPLKSNGKLDVGGCVGNKGRITVIKGMGLKNNYSGSSELISGELAEDFASYYTVSEQIPTAMALGVKIGKTGQCVGAGGVVIQALPYAEESVIKKAEEVMTKFSAISTLIEEFGAEGVIEKFFGDVKCEKYFPEYKCLCSKEKIDEMLISLGKHEVDKLIKEDGKIEVGCQFCNKKYIYEKKDCEKLF